MKKILCIFLMVFFVFSFSGCLKNDYDALTRDIENLYEDSDDLKDDIDETKEKIESIKTEIENAEEQMEKLDKESDALYREKDNIEESIKTIEYKGLGITKFQFEAAFYNLNKLDDYFTDIDIGILPYQYISGKGRTLKYYPYIENETTQRFYISIILCEDNLHIKEIYQIVSEDIVDTYKSFANKYLYAVCLSLIMAKDGNLDDIDYAYDIMEIMIDEEPVFNDTVQYYLSFDDGYYLTSIYDISD